MNNNNLSVNPPPQSVAQPPHPPPPHPHQFQFQNQRVQAPPQEQLFSNSNTNHQHQRSHINDIDMDDDEATVRETLQYINSSSLDRKTLPPGQSATPFPHHDPHIRYVPPVVEPNDVALVNNGSYQNEEGKNKHTIVLIYVLIGGIVFSLTSILPVSSITKVVLSAIRIDIDGCIVRHLIDVLIRTIIFVTVFFLSLKSFT